MFYGIDMKGFTKLMIFLKFIKRNKDIVSFNPVPSKIEFHKKGFRKALMKKNITTTSSSILRLHTILNIKRKNNLSELKHANNLDEPLSKSRNFFHTRMNYFKKKLK